MGYSRIGPFLGGRSILETRKRAWEGAKSGLAPGRGDFGTIVIP
jgi:hypothetical protein